MVGTSFGAYRIKDKLGAGGMGVVYLATDTNLDRPVAIKTLLAVNNANPESVSRFLREAQAASHLQHPAIMTIHHFGVEGDTRFIVMEFVEGRNLKKVIDGQPMELSQQCEIAIQIADGLAAAHERGMIHCDLKAENIMITPRGHAKILDFGLAKLKEPEAVEESNSTVSFGDTTSSTVFGTVSHMSPEQALAIEIDTRTDIFSFGIVLYEMATGKMPFDGPTPQATLARILSQEAVPVSRVSPDVPPELAHLIAQSLQKDRTCRPTAREMHSRLKNIQASLSANKLASSQIRPPGFDSSKYLASSLYMDRAAPVATQVPARVRPPRPAPYARLVLEAIRGSRIAFSLVLWALPLAFFAAFVLSGNIVRREAVEGTVLMSLVRAIAVPVQEAVNGVLNFSLVSGDFDFMLLVLGAAALVLRIMLLQPVRRAEAWASQLVESPKPARSRA
ncbi:MAG: serine/threonine-protein kinase [Terriglobales bacterium]